MLLRFLGSNVENSSITCENIQVCATWNVNPNISERWGLNWHMRDDERVDICCSIILKGCILPRHGHVTEVVEVGMEHVHIMICLPPNENSSGIKDYIVIVFP